MFIILLCYLIYASGSQLIINVKNQGGEILEETIAANASEDVILLEFQRVDGTLITQLVDFKKEVQIIRALILGEEERGQSQYQVICFVTHAVSDDFIAPEVMTKLRQKNPAAIRVAENDRGVTNVSLDMTLYVSGTKASKLISRHISSVCSEATDSTYTSYDDILTWNSLPGIKSSVLMANVKHSHTLSSAARDAKCSDVNNIWMPCTCRLNLTIPWYPCGLKFCKTKQLELYKCGIKTCRKSYNFNYYVRHKQLCLWDEW